MEKSNLAPAVRSTLDVSDWFVARADSANCFLPALKLQQLLYLAQIEFAKANGGQKLIPATFLAATSGPLEPTIYHIYESGAENLQTRYPEPEIESFLMGIWGTYGDQPMETLRDTVTSDVNFLRALRSGRNHEIQISALYAVEQGTDRAASGPPGAKKKRKKYLGISTTGKRATKWEPGSYGRGKGTATAPPKPWTP